MDINRVQIVGHATKDPEVKRLTTGQELARVNIATNYSWIDSKSKEKRETTEFHKVVVWGKLAELLKKYLHKGEKVLIEGRLLTRSWEVKGVKHQQTEVVANNIVLLAGKKTTGTTEVLVEETSLEDLDED